MLDEDIIRADGWIIIAMLICFLFLVIFLPLIALMSIIVYPSFTLLIYAILNIYNDLNRKDRISAQRFLSVIFGLIGLLFSIFILNLILSQPNVTLGCIIRLIAFPIAVTGIAGIIKGITIKLYSIEWRRFNILLGIITITFTIIALVYAEIGFFFHFLFVLIIVLFLNMIFRSAMYLSEFGLSIWKQKHLKIVYYIVNNYPLENEEFSKLL